MNKKYIVVIFSVLFSIFSSNFVFATTIQPVVSPVIVSPAVVTPLPVLPTDTSLEPKTSKTLSAGTLSTLFVKLNKVDKEIGALSADLKVKGFQPLTGKTSFWGVRNTYSQRTAEGKEAKTILSIFIQDYASPANSKDIAALGQIEIIGDCGRREIYSFYLIAPNGSFENAQEYKVDQSTLSVLRANSWWSCVVYYLKSRCTSVCINALLTCPTSSWAVYAGCLASKCGWCWVKAGICCACNCRWWCRGWSGCCHQ